MAFGCVAGFAPAKNHLFLLEAFARARRPDARLVLVGDGALRAEAEARASALGIAGRVRFTGARADVARLLQGMDAMLLPSRFEGFPLVALEWQCAGLPAWLSDAVTRDCALTGQVRFLPLEADRWAEAIERARPADRARRSAEGVEAVERAAMGWRRPRARSSGAISSWRTALACKISVDFLRQLCYNENNLRASRGIRGGSGASAPKLNIPEVNPMKNSSILSCEHIHVRRVPGRTDAFLAALKVYLETLFSLSDEFGSAEIRIANDGREFRFEWAGGELPGPGGEAIDGMAEASEIDVRVNMCCDLFDMDEAQAALARELKGGALKDCVRCCTLIEDEQTASLTMSGIYRGAFLQGAVPFTTDNEDILVATRWNGFTHRAEFRLREAEADAAGEIADALEGRLEIELSRSDDGRALAIGALQLDGRAQVEFYRDALERLCRMSESSLITGSLAPEDDAVFALLRFVRDGADVVVQTAVAEA